MSHKLQLHLLLDHISAKVTANASYRAMFISQPRLWPIYPFVFENSGYHSQTLISFGGGQDQNKYVKESHTPSQLSNICLCSHVLHIQQICQGPQDVHLCHRSLPQLVTSLFLGRYNEQWTDPIWGMVLFFFFSLSLLLFSHK